MGERQGKVMGEITTKLDMVTQEGGINPYSQDKRKEKDAIDKILGGYGYHVERVKGDTYYIQTVTKERYKIYFSGGKWQFNPKTLQTVQHKKQRTYEEQQEDILLTELAHTIGTQTRYNTFNPQKTTPHEIENLMGEVFQAYGVTGATMSIKSIEFQTPLGNDYEVKFSKDKNFRVNRK